MNKKVLTLCAGVLLVGGSTVFTVNALNAGNVKAQSAYVMAAETASEEGTVTGYEISTAEKSDAAAIWTVAESSDGTYELTLGNGFGLNANAELVKDGTTSFAIGENGVISGLVISNNTLVAGTDGTQVALFDTDGNVVDEWTSTEKTHKIEGLIVGEEYTLREEFAPDGYVRAKDQKFTVENTAEIQKVDMIDKKVEILKTDVEGNSIEGVTLVITNTRTKNIVDKWVTTKEAHSVSGLIEGETYILHEEKTVGDFVKAKDIEFTVTEDKETQIITMVDKIVEVSKIDSITKERIKNAELMVIDEDGNIVDSWKTSQESHKVKGLEEGKKYKLVEKNAPYGYALAKEIEFIVTDDKETQIVEMEDMPILTDIKVNKIDSETKEIIKDKFTFAIYSDKECTKLIKEIEANKKDGFVIFEDLRYGEYYIKEIVAPQNYNLSNEVIKVEINDNGVFVNGELMQEEENSIYSFEFENTKIETPKTNDNRNQTILNIIASISAISLLGIGIYEFIKRRKNK